MQEPPVPACSGISAKTTVINQLFCSFGLLTSHFFCARSPLTTSFLDYYFSVKLEGFKGTETLATAFDRFSPRTQIICARLLLQTPLSNFGCFGEAHPRCLEILKNFKPKKAIKLRSLFKYLELSEPELFKTKFKHVSEETLVSQARKYLKKHPRLTVHASNKQGVKLLKITKHLHDLAAHVAPRHRTKNFPYHLNLLKEAFLTADIQLPRGLAQDIHKSYTDVFQDHVPLSVLITLLYQTNLGVDRLPNLATLGHYFGFSGHKTNNFNYLKRHNKLLSSYISYKYKLSYEQICRVQKNTGKPTRLHFYDGEVSTSFLPESLPKSLSPFYLTRVKDGLLSQEVVGHSEGKQIVDLTNVQHDRTFTEINLKYTFEHKIRLLTPANQSRGGRSSLFTNENHEARAFADVDINPITKPDLSLREPTVDKRWLPVFDDYLSTDFSLPKLLEILKKDVAFFKKIKPTVKKLYKKVQKGTVEISRLSHEELEDFFHNNTELLDPLDYESRSLYAYYSSAIDSWFNQIQHAPLYKKKKTVSLRQIKEPKKRTVCRTPVDVALFEKFSNRIFQVIYQKINRDLFNYSVSNYLPGMATPLYTMERFKEKIAQQDFDLCNLDVKSCFDNVNLLHPNFEKRLDLGLIEIEKFVSKGAANFLKFVFKDFLLQNMRANKFAFKASKGFSGDLPPKGALPTGFVLSPALWLTLALPALVKTQDQLDQGNLLCFDLCGDDLIAVAPRNLAPTLKEEICKPWFELAADLDLKFHFFKNYTDKRIKVAPKWEHIFKHKKNAPQVTKSAWVESFPARSIPIFHGGVCLARKTIIETVTSISKDKSLSKLYMSLHKKKQHQAANFVPKVLLRFIPDSGSRLSTLTTTTHRPEANRENQEAKTNLDEILYGGVQFCGKHFDREKQVSSTRFFTLQSVELFLRSWRSTQLHCTMPGKGFPPTDP